jgi:hypothetical protein
MSLPVFRKPDAFASGFLISTKTRCDSFGFLFLMPDVLNRLSLDLAEQEERVASCVSKDDAIRREFYG